MQHLCIKIVGVLLHLLELEVGWRFHRSLVLFRLCIGRLETRYLHNHGVVMLGLSALMVLTLENSNDNR